VFPQHGVDPRLPLGAGGAEEIDDVGIEAQGNQPLSPFLPLADQEVTLAETHPEKRLIGYARVSDSQLEQPQVVLCRLRR
jgi:hypothetical protein